VLPPALLSPIAPDGSDPGSDGRQLVRIRRLFAIAATAGSRAARSTPWR
jgi:hypothetical protein